MLLAVYPAHLNYQGGLWLPRLVDKLDGSLPKEYPRWGFPTENLAEDSILISCATVGQCLMLLHVPIAIVAAIKPAHSNVRHVNKQRFNTWLIPRGLNSKPALPESTRPHTLRCMQLRPGGRPESELQTTKRI